MMACEQEEGRQQVVDRKGMCERQLQTFGARLAQLKERQPSATDPPDGCAFGGLWQPVNGSL